MIEKTHPTEGGVIHDWVNDQDFPQNALVFLLGLKNRLKPLKRDILYSSGTLQATGNPAPFPWIFPWTTWLYSFGTSWKRKRS